MTVRDGAGPSLVPQPESFDRLWWNALLNAEQHRHLLRLRVEQREEVGRLLAEHRRRYAAHAEAPMDEPWWRCHRRFSALFPDGDPRRGA